MKTSCLAKDVFNMIGIFQCIFANLCKNIIQCSPFITYPVTMI